MSTQQNNTITHLSAERLHELSAAYGDSDAILVKRALAVWRALGEGVEVKTMAADLADANRANPDVNVVSERYLGLAKFATTAADIIGVDLRAWAKRSPQDVAYAIRTAKRVGLKVATTTVRDAVKPIDAEKKSDREEAAMTALGVKRAEVLAAATPSAPRQKKSDPDEKSTPTFSAEMTAAEALAAIRAVTAWLGSDRGSYSPDLASAGAEFAAAMSSARKRGHDAAARTAGTLVETAAA